MSRNDRIKLALADTLARLVIYGPLAAAAVIFSPVSLIVVAMAAAQPWLGEGLGVAADWMTKKAPGIMGPINGVLDHYAGMQWWKHASVLIGALAVAIVPTPAVAALLPGAVRSALGLIGGTSGVWTKVVLPFAFATGLPFATRMATDGFEWAFQRIPALRDLSIQRQQNRRDRADQRHADRESLVAARRGVARGGLDGASSPTVDGPEPFVGATNNVVSSAAGTPQTTAEAPPVSIPRQAQPRIDLRRVLLETRERMPERGRILPDVVLISTPPRVPARVAPSTQADRDLAF